MYNLKTGGVSVGAVSILDRHPFQRDVQEGVSLLQINKLCASKFDVTICSPEHKEIRSRHKIKVSMHLRKVLTLGGY